MVWFGFVTVKVVVTWLSVFLCAMTIIFHIILSLIIIHTCKVASFASLWASVSSFTTATVFVFVVVVISSWSSRWHCNLLTADTLVVRLSLALAVLIPSRLLSRLFTDLFVFVWFTLSALVSIISLVHDDEERYVTMKRGLKHINYCCTATTILDNENYCDDGSWLVTLWRCRLFLETSYIENFNIVLVEQTLTGLKNFFRLLLLHVLFKLVDADSRADWADFVLRRS